MQCPNCGHENKPDNIFCVKCATVIKNRPRLERVKHAFMPPQNEHVVDPRTVRPSKPSVPRSKIDWSWLLLGVALFALLLFLIYG